MENKECCHCEHCQKTKERSPEEYRASTGFECLLGWLYLNGQLNRVHELFDTLWQQFDPNQK